MDNNVPLQISELEELVQIVSHNLYAKWAEEARFTEQQMTQYAQYAVDDTVYVINEYMIAVNDLMSRKAATQSLLDYSPASTLTIPGM